MLTDLVKNHISNIVKFVGYFEDEFVKIVVDEDYKRIQATQKRNMEELERAIMRDKEIDTLIEKLFEEKVLAHLSEERFLKMTERYEDEQAELKQKIKNLKRIVTEEKKHELNADGFLKIVRKYSEIQCLTPEILAEFIDKIIVHHREKIQGETTQKVEIYYKMIGNVEIPVMSKKETKMYTEHFGINKKERSA